VNHQLRHLFKNKYVRVLFATARSVITEAMPFTNPATHSMGGKSTQAKLTPEQRKENSVRLAKARWNKVKRLKKAA
jgi:hypothetical protein